MSSCQRPDHNSTNCNETCKLADTGARRGRGEQVWFNLKVRGRIIPDAAWYPPTPDTLAPARPFSPPLHNATYPPASLERYDRLLYDSTPGLRVTKK